MKKLIYILPVILLLHECTTVFKYQEVLGVSHDDIKNKTEEDVLSFNIKPEIRYFFYPRTLVLHIEFYNHAKDTFIINRHNILLSDKTGNYIPLSPCKKSKLKDKIIVTPESEIGICLSGKSKKDVFYAWDTLYLEIKNSIYPLKKTFVLEKP